MTLTAQAKLMGFCRGSLGVISFSDRTRKARPNRYNPGYPAASGSAHCRGYAESGATRVGLTLTEPAPTGSEQWDAAIAALCEYRLQADHLPVPNWITKRIGFPTKPWAPRTSGYNIPADPTKVPEEFLRRGILIEAQTLESV